MFCIAHTLGLISCVWEGLRIGFASIFDVEL